MLRFKIQKMVLNKKKKEMHRKAQDKINEKKYQYEIDISFQADDKN